jgi:hypothetical protein
MFSACSDDTPPETVPFEGTVTLQFLRGIYLIDPEEMFDCRCCLPAELEAEVVRTIDVTDGYFHAELPPGNYTVIVSGSRVYTSVAHVISHWDNDDYWLNQNITVRPREPKDITDVFECPNFLWWVRVNVSKWFNNDPIFDYDVAHITRAWLGGHGITSLAGIEYFTSLRDLTIASNQLTSLDLSHNRHLTFLSAWGNQLSSVNTSNSKYLQSIYLYYNNLTELNISNNKYIERLYLYGNNLTKLDLSNNYYLMDVVIWFNNLTQLDVSNNPNLQMLNVQDNRMQSPDDVIGWREIGLILGQNFYFSPQKSHGLGNSDNLHMGFHMDDILLPLVTSPYNNDSMYSQ